jgi:hypothetical protein
MEALPKIDALSLFSENTKKGAKQHFRVLFF